MSEFLFGPKILDAINSSVTHAKSASIDLAVAYWGRGMADELKLLDTAAPVRILCDLNSGFCDPDELKRLLRRNNTRIKTRNGLHSKVYLGPHTVVVGSANASNRGLKKLSDLEAAISDATSVAAARKWFDVLWNEEESLDVDEEILKSAPPPQSSLTFLTLLTMAPALLAHFKIHFVALIEPSLKRCNEQYEETWTAIKALRPPIYSAAELQHYGDDYPFYIDQGKSWTLSLGTFVVSFWLYADTTKPAEIGGVYRVKKIGDLNGKRIIFGQPIHDTNRMFGFSIPPKERKIVEKLIDHCVRKRFERLGASSHHAIEISADELALAIPSVL
ncbi:phospholipase D-like domain-containing protein [Bradyrhizobium sp. WSM471]|uniref:phospholipase D-like domain-containing protein n=1 Tax=Bradyrhizobium sp. WSM471 TaxID=319017 RepID=UPI00024D201D|nr:MULTISPECIES: phospholipase D-like domain-containing protein [Bradyrhizobium]EHR01242.1 hypothetical protein Bra471DRAFT_01944 [Bradyrhizobium sp. WSM471]UFW43306.1 phospholipase D-like domain-containing protein [Bradyrhizobium canariense]